MGFYDACGLISGVSLLGSRRVGLLVLERPKGRGFIPVTAPIFGSYDRLGSIDGIEVDAHAEHVLAFFLARHGEGQLHVTWDDMPMTSIESLEDLFRTIERGVTQGYESAKLRDIGLSFALIDHEVWRGAVLAAAALSDEGWLPFPRPASLSHEIYGDEVRNAFGPQLAEVSHVERFMKAHRLVWRPTRSDGQHDLTDTVPKLLARARSRWQQVPEIAEALDRYAQLVPT